MVRKLTPFNLFVASALKNAPFRARLKAQRTQGATHSTINGA